MLTLYFLLMLTECALFHPKTRRLLTIDEHVDTNLLAKKKKQSGKTMASNIMTLIGVLALSALLYILLNYVFCILILVIMCESTCLTNLEPDHISSVVL